MKSEACGRAGIAPSHQPDARSAEPMKASKTRISPLDAAMVATEEPGTRRRRMATLSASPPRAGTKALNATPAA
jgi:hypothetical protein